MVKKLLSNKYLIACSLLLLWLFLSLFYIFNNNFSFSIISYSHSNAVISGNTGRLMKGESVKTDFLAQEDNLGIVTMKFSPLDKVPYADEDILRFNLYEYGKQKPYYSSLYRSGLLTDQPVFPFGFPRISNSKGKHYIVKLTSLAGNEENALSLSNQKPILVTRYQVSKSLLLSNKKELLKFGIRKIGLSIHNRDVIFFSFTYALPLLFYLFLISKPGEFAKVYFLDKFHGFTDSTYVPWFLKPVDKEYLRFKRALSNNFELLLFFSILIDIVFIDVVNDITVVLIALLWIFISKKNNVHYTKNFKISLFLIIFSTIILALGEDNIANKSSLWAFIFIFIGFLKSFSDSDNFLKK